jgi:hypothetical protein
MHAGVLAYVYIGSLANDVGEIIAGRTHVSPAVTIISAVASGVFIIGAMVLITVYARRAIKRCEHPSLQWLVHLVAPAILQHAAHPPASSPLPAGELWL